MLFHLSLGKEIRSPKPTFILVRTLDCDIRKCDSQTRQRSRKGFRNSFRGLFSLQFSYSVDAISIRSLAIAPFVLVVSIKIEEFVHNEIGESLITSSINLDPTLLRRPSEPCDLKPLLRLNHLGIS